MRISVLLAAAPLLLLVNGCSRKPTAGQQKPLVQTASTATSGSSACRGCHPAFYKKWATSHHGLAMQPFSPALASASLTAHPEPLKIGNSTYQVFFDQSSGYVEERGANASRKLPIQHVMGGKNVFYFLTPLERGRLQVLPLAYDIQKKQWYDMAASGVRMHIGGPVDAPLPWTDSAFTFNTSCYSCHVSQLKTNYDVATDSYNSTWKEPGINCESCHNDGQAHIDQYKNSKGEKFEDMRILPRQDEPHQPGLPGDSAVL